MITRASRAQARYRQFIQFVEQEAHRHKNDEHYFLTPSLILAHFDWTADQLAEILKKAQTDNVVAPVLVYTVVPPVPAPGYLINDLKEILVSARTSVVTSAKPLSALTELCEIAERIIEDNRNESRSALAAAIAAPHPEARSKRERSLVYNLAQPLAEKLEHALNRLESRERELLQRVAAHDKLDIIQEKYTAYQILGVKGLAEKYEREQQQKSNRDDMRAGFFWMLLWAKLGIALLAAIIYGGIHLYRWREETRRIERAECESIAEKFEQSDEPLVRKALNTQYGKQNCVYNFQLPKLPEE